MVLASAPRDSWREGREEVGKNWKGGQEPGCGLLRTRICNVHFSLRKCCSN